MDESWTVYGQPVRGRSCGSCTACCIQVPVELGHKHKEANERCEFLCSRGCTIYARRPEPCKFWSCRWLFDAKTADLKRPDKSGYIIDSMLDHIVNDGTVLPVLQVWVDPARREAHRDPALRAYIAGINLAAIVRWDSRDGIVLVPPALSGEPDWLELRGKMNSQADMNLRIAAAGGVPDLKLSATLAP